MNRHLWSCLQRLWAIVVFILTSSRRCAHSLVHPLITRLPSPGVFSKIQFCKYIMLCWPNVFFEHSSVCYCSMATLGTWIQCEIAESLCNPNMIKNGRMGPSTTWNGEAVDRVQWFESLVIASTRYQVLVKQGTATPVQYNTSFIQHGKQIVSRPSPLFFFPSFFPLWCDVS